MEPVPVLMGMGLCGYGGMDMDTHDCHGTAWPGRIVFKSPVLRPEKDWKKTGQGPVFWKTAVLVFRILKRKTAKRPVYMDRFRPV